MPTKDAIAAGLVLILSVLSAFFIYLAETRKTTIEDLEEDLAAAKSANDLLQRQIEKTADLLSEQVSKTEALRTEKDRISRALSQVKRDDPEARVYLDTRIPSSVLAGLRNIQNGDSAAESTGRADSSGK